MARSTCGDLVFPAVRELELEAEQAYTADEIATVKTWLVTSRQRLRHIAQR